MRKTLILSLCLALLCGLALGGCGSETPKKDRSTTPHTR